MSDSQRDYVRQTVESRGTRLVRLWFTDVLGQLKSFAISPAELDTAFEEGLVFDGSSVDGYSRVQEADVLAWPDPSSFELLRWTRGEPSDEARMFCDITTLDGAPFDGDPRRVLRRQLDLARDRGFSFYIGPEIEFFFLESDDVTAPAALDQGSYFGLSSTDESSTMLVEIVTVLEGLGIPVEYSLHEDSPGQHEIDLRYADALAMADSVMTLRPVVRRVAALHGRHATFMPKPLGGVQGSGMHLHLSLFEGDQNAFHDPAGQYGISAVGRHFVAGLLRHAREIAAITNPTVNSYKRLVEGFEAPVHVTWARNNQSALVRIPTAKRGKVDSTRVEFRAPDPSGNPYLAFAVILAAGLRGIDERYELPAETTVDVNQMTRAERAAAGIERLPKSLREALDVMEGSDLVAETLGTHIFEWFLRNKRDEAAAYRRQVTPFELERYLPSV